MEEGGVFTLGAKVDLARVFENLENMSYLM